LSDIILNLTTHQNPQIAELAISKLNTIDLDEGATILPLINHDHPKVKLAAIRYLMSHNSSLDINFLLDKLNDPNLNMNSTALLAFAMEYQNNPKTLSFLQMERRVDEILQYINNAGDETDVKKELLPISMKIIAYIRYKKMYDVIFEHLKKPNAFRRHAIHALGIIKDISSINQILAIMESDETVVSDGIKSLSYFDLAPILTYALDILGKDPNSKQLQFIAEVLGFYPEIEAVDLLIRFTKTENKVLTRKAITTLNTIVSNNPLIPVNKKLINNLLFEEINYYQDLIHTIDKIEPIDTNRKEKEIYDSLRLVFTQIIDVQLQTIFNLLNISYPPENIDYMRTIFESTDSELRANAIEYLNNLLSTSIKNELFPILESDLSFIASVQDTQDIDYENLRTYIETIENKTLRLKLLQFFKKEFGK
jgi:HEAT repeat protein